MFDLGILWISVSTYNYLSVPRSAYPTYHSRAGSLVQSDLQVHL